MTDDLERHREAREESWHLVSDLADLTDSSVHLITNSPDSLNLPPSHLASFSRFSSQVSGIREILARRQYKVVFLGRTSSGKSTLINALLGERVLPTGLGHTTASFLQVQGTTDTQPSLLLPHCQTPVRGLQEVTAALRSQAVREDSEDSLLTLLWPRHWCALLQEDVVLVDSPGLDVTPSHDHWIDTFCQDSDIFVLVANAESTVMMREKMFFQEVADKISNPNIVIIENRWDCAELEDEEMIEMVKRQHLDRCSDFLRDLSGNMASSHTELQSKVFFTSGKEMLNLKTRGEKFLRSQPSLQFGERKEDFDRFELSLRHHLTRSSLETKYQTHFNTGKSICHQLILIMEEMADQAVGLEKTYQEEIDKKTRLIEEYNFEMENMTADLREEIKHMMETITQRISVVFHEELNNLNFMMKDFKLRYSDDRMVNMIYFQEMEKFLQKGLEMNMKNRIASQITMQVKETQENMVMQITEKFPDFQEDLSLIKPKYPPEISFSLTTNSCQDFHYDGTFQFSYGIFYWAREHRGLISRMFPQTGDLSPSLGPSASQQNLPALSKLAFFILASQNTMSGMFAGSLVCRRVWLRVGALLLCSHALLYMYERLLWVTGGREKATIRTFLAHFQSRMRLLIHTVTGSVRQQIQKELQSSLSLVCSTVENNVRELQHNILQTQLLLTETAGVTDNLEDLSRKAADLGVKLEEFEDKYLQ